MKMKLRPTALALAGLCAASLSSPAAASEGEGWSWAIAPYIWFASIGTDHKRDVPPSEGSNDTSFDDILDKLDGVLMLHAEGQGDHVGVFGDLVFIGLGDSKDFTNLRTKSQFDATLFDAAVVWSPGDERFTGFELFGGLRYIDLDMSVKFTPNNPDLPTVEVDPSESYSDFLIGGRYTAKLSDRWGLTMRLDGSFGETDGSFNTSAVFDYKMKHGAWVFGYRYFDVELSSENDNVKTNITVHGPEVGYAFRF